MWLQVIPKNRRRKGEIAPSFVADAKSRADFQARLLEWFRADGRPLPWRATRDPYAVFVSEMMLQQTQVATVLPYYDRWMKRFPDAAALAAADEQEVLGYWAGLGYYARARNLIKAARVIVEKYGGVFPQDHDSIRELPGVGRYTAGAVASFALGHPVPAVDANVARVLARLLDLREPIDSTTGAEVLWATAAGLIPAEAAREFNSAIMELGALICRSGRPTCLLCPVRAHCRATAPETLPLKRARPATVYLEERYAYVVKARKVLLERQTGAKWNGLWTLPALEGAPGPLLLALTYPYTKHQISMAVHSAVAPKKLGPDQQWIADPDSVPMPSPHRKALRRLIKESRAEGRAGAE